MSTTENVQSQDTIILVGRILMALLFIIFGWGKLMNYSGTVQYMIHVGSPVPPIAAVVAIIMETIAPLAIIVGVATRPIALLLALYTLGTALIGHHYWTMTGMDRVQNEINFFKNISIIGGLLLLYVTGPGKYALRGKFAKGR